MKVQTLCKNCSKYYAYFDDCGEPLVEGCNLDIPFFHHSKPVECSSYRDKGRRL